MTLLNLLFTWLVSLCICILTARGFLGNGQPGLLLFGCGSLMWGVTSLSAAVVLDRVNTAITVHNLGVFGAALCHLIGMLWRGRLPFPRRWLVVGYALALMIAALIFWSAAAGLTPLFFRQGQGGTLVRQVFLISAITTFAWVAWQMLHKFWRQSGDFYYWYGLGLALVATGLTGVALLKVQGSILGWTNRLTQYLGSTYLLIAAVAAARETGWKLSLSAVEDAWLRKELLPAIENKQLLRVALRYGFAVLAMGLSWVGWQQVTARFGPGLDPYIIFFPLGIVVVVFAGFGPGVLATLLMDLIVVYWILPPVGEFAIASPIGRLGLLICTVVSLFFCALMELYRRNRDKASAFDREAALRESRERLAMFAEATFEGIVESNAGRIVDCNEQLARMLGYSVSELRGREIASLICPENSRSVMENILQDRDSAVEHELLRKDGKRIVVEAHGRAVSEGIARRHTAIRDITERKRGEEALRESQERNRLLVETMLQGVVHQDAEGKIISMNPAAECILGKKREQFLGSSSVQEEHDTLRPDGSPFPGADHPSMVALRTGQHQRGEIMGVFNPILNDYRWIKIDAVPVFHPKKANPVEVYTVFEDITERKRGEQALHEAQAQLKTYADNLEKTVAERTAALIKRTAERERLQEELLKISEREKQLIAQELHDGLCQHFAGTAMMSALLHRSLASRQDPAATQAKEILDLLSTGVIEARNLSHGLHPVKDKSDGLMESLTGLAQIVRKLFHVQCTFRCDDEVLIHEQATATHLFRIIQEAVNNAIKHGQASKVVITLKADSKRLYVSIRDNGIGIPCKLPVSKGMGMQIMNHRAEVIGAVLSIRRGGKCGTVVNCTLPVPG